MYYTSSQIQALRQETNNTIRPTKSNLQACLIPYPLSNTSAKNSTSPKSLFPPHATALIKKVRG